MHTLNQIADWVYSLTPHGLACFFVVVFSTLGGLVVVLMAIFGDSLRRDLPEANGEMPETHQPNSACLRSVCAWCEPKAKGPGITHGICPDHAEAMKREAELTREYGPLK